MVVCSTCVRVYTAVHEKIILTFFLKALTKLACDKLIFHTYFLSLITPIEPF